MTFIVGKDGVVYQKDLGEKTTAIAEAMTAYDPGDGWSRQFSCESSCAPTDPYVAKNFLKNLRAARPYQIDAAAEERNCKSWPAIPTILWAASSGVKVPTSLPLPSVVMRSLCILLKTGQDAENA